jgi:hypothetical protein
MRASNTQSFRVCIFRSFRAVNLSAREKNNNNKSVWTATSHAKAVETAVISLLARVLLLSLHVKEQHTLCNTESSIA